MIRFGSIRARSGRSVGANPDSRLFEWVWVDTFWYCFSACLLVLKFLIGVQKICHVSLGSGWTVVGQLVSNRIEAVRANSCLFGLNPIGMSRLSSGSFGVMRAVGRGWFLKISANTSS